MTQVCLFPGCGLHFSTMGANDAKGNRLGPAFQPLSPASSLESLH